MKVCEQSKEKEHQEWEFSEIDMNRNLNGRLCINNICLLTWQELIARKTLLLDQTNISWSTMANENHARTLLTIEKRIPGDQIIQRQVSDNKYFCSVFQWFDNT